MALPTQFVYKTTGSCARQIIVALEDGIIRDVAFDGGCDGNHRGIRSLVCGRAADEVVRLLKATTCDGRDTSCPDQLARALEAAMGGKQ